MGRTLTIKKGGPSPYSEGWHTVKITSAEYGEWNDAKYIDVYFDGYSDKMNLRCYAKENAEGEEFAIGKLFRFANAGITDALDDGSGNMVVKMNDEAEELVGKHINIFLYKDGEYSKVLKEVAPIPFKNVVEEFTDKDVDFWKGRALQYFDKYVKPKLTEDETTVDAEMTLDELTKVDADKLPF
tara:strand:+ start:2842 stop:3393 length:552 start_codon:yes stop_codon:yes gene_type:complete